LSGEYSIQALGYGNDKIENGQFWAAKFLVIYYIAVEN
jgi:hypothetical protein